MFMNITARHITIQLVEQLINYTFIARKLVFQQNPMITIISGAWLPVCRSFTFFY